MGALALSGVIFGGIGERTGLPPTEKEYDNIAHVLTVAAKHAKTRNIELGVEAVNRYENHLINTGAQAAWMVEKVGADNVFVHLDTYHMNIEEKGVGKRDLGLPRPSEIYSPFRKRPRHAGNWQLCLGRSLCDVGRDRL